MNNDYKSVVKEIDEMLLERQIDKLLNIKKQNENKQRKKKIDNEKTRRVYWIIETPDDFWQLWGGNDYDSMGNIAYENIRLFQVYVSTIFL